MTLADELARKAKDLTADMLSRLHRLPDTADYRAAFDALINSHPNIAQSLYDDALLAAKADFNLSRSHHRIRNASDIRSK